MLQALAQHWIALQSQLSALALLSVTPPLAIAAHLLLLLTVLRAAVTELRAEGVLSAMALLALEVKRMRAGPINEARRVRVSQPS